MGVMGPDQNLTAGHTSQTRAFSSYKSSYFHSEWGKRWAYGIVIDTVPPPPPDELTVRADSARKRVVVSFKLPLNQQRDIYFMRLFRKLQDQNGADITGWVRVGSNWGPENVLYFDTDVDFFQNNQIRYVYTAQTVTRHNEYSSFSDQLSTRLNKDFMTYGEYPVDFVSQAGVRVEHHGAFGTYPHRRFFTEVIVPNEVRFSFSGRSAHGNIALDGNQYFVRVESLDTGEKFDYPIEIIYNNQPARVEKKDLSVFVSAFKMSKGKEERSSVLEPVFRDWGETGELPRTNSAGVAGHRVFMPSGIR
jgi:hypothetical protein